MNDPTVRATRRGAGTSATLRWISSLHPLWWAASSVFSTLLVLILGWLLSSLDSLIPTTVLDPVGLLLVGTLFGTTVASCVGAASTYRFNERRLAGLLMLYLAIGVLYADIYFLLQLAMGRDAPVRGVHEIWTYLPLQGRTLEPSDVLLAFVDCLHLSIVTLTTVGYGDISPQKWYAKLIADTEALLGVGFVAVSLGRYFHFASHDAARSAERDEAR